jgi:Rrf2 family nitric oxide-sensitive transcriptional repressor
MYLATCEGRATVRDVAGLFGISANHVAKVVQVLSRLGYVRSTRGIGGGIELARPADALRLGDVIESLEGNMHLLECVDSQNVCALESFCKLKTALSHAERLQMDYLNTLSVSDIVPTKGQLSSVVPLAALR